MLDRLKKDNKGFTIIEVLIVLAIAGLIMLIVFLAVPALQRNQRNNARNSDASRISASISECLANRNGQTGSCDTTTLDANFCATAASELQVGCLNQITGGANATGTASTTFARINFGTGSGGCNAAGDAVAAGGSARSFSVTYQLEPSTARCISS